MVSTSIINYLINYIKSDQKQYPVVGTEEIMSQKSHGTTEKPVMKNLRWNCDWDKADR